MQGGRGFVLAVRASRTPRGVHSPHIYLCELRMLMSVVEPRGVLGLGAIGPTLNTVFFVYWALGSNCGSGFGSAADMEICPGPIAEPQWAQGESEASRTVSSNNSLKPRSG